VKAGIQSLKRLFAIPSGFSNKKFQIPNTKQITMTEIQNPKQLTFDLI